MTQAELKQAYLDTFAAGLAYIDAVAAQEFIAEAFSTAIDTFVSEYPAFGDIDANIADLIDSVIDLEADVITLQNALATAQSDIADLQTDVSNLQSAISVLTDKAVGGYHMTDNVTGTTINNTTYFEKIAGTTIEQGYVNHFSHSNNRATYTGPSTKWFLVTATASISAPNSANAFRMRIAKNGTTIPESGSRTRTQANAVAEYIACQCVVQLATNEYIEIFVRNTTSTQTLTAQMLNVFVQQIN